MAGAYTILPAHSVVVSRGWGTLTDRDALAHARALAVDPHFAPNYRQLADLRDVIHMDVTGPGIRQLIQASPFGSGARRAIVVGDDVGYGLARMYEILWGKTPDDFAVFRELNQGIQWLGLDAVTSELLETLRRTTSVLDPE